MIRLWLKSRYFRVVFSCKAVQRAWHAFKSQKPFQCAWRRVRDKEFSTPCQKAEACSPPMPFQLISSSVRDSLYESISRKTWQPDPVHELDARLRTCMVLDPCTASAMLRIPLSPILFPDKSHSATCNSSLQNKAAMTVAPSSPSSFLATRRVLKSGPHMIAIFTMSFAPLLLRQLSLSSSSLIRL